MKEKTKWGGGGEGGESVCVHVGKFTLKQDFIQKEAAKPMENQNLYYRSLMPAGDLLQLWTAIIWTSLSATPQGSMKALEYFYRLLGYSGVGVNKDVWV